MLSSEEYWEERATELSRSGLDTIRSAATAWAATTTALLGLFGTVMVIKGPDSVAKLEGATRWVVTVLLLAAAITGFVSILATAFAGRGAIRRVAPLTGRTLVAWTRSTSRNAQRALRLGRWTAIGAAVLVLAAGSFALVAQASTAAPAEQSFLVRTQSGAVDCGVLRRSGVRLVLADRAGKTLLDLGSAIADTTPVSACPSI